MPPDETISMPPLLTTVVTARPTTYCLPLLLIVVALAMPLTTSCRPPLTVRPNRCTAADALKAGCVDDRTTCNAPTGDSLIAEAEAGDASAAVVDCFVQRCAQALPTSSSPAAPRGTQSLVAGPRAYRQAVLRAARSSAAEVLSTSLPAAARSPRPSTVAVRKHRQRRHRQWCFRPQVVAPF